MITDLQKKLDRLNNAPPPPKRSKHDISQALDAELVINKNGSGFIVKYSEFDIGIPYGNYTLENIETEFQLSERLVFVDTETTGLGAGACPFLIGAAYYDDNKLILEQLFMRDIDDEEAVLNYFINKFSGMNVVSFNGKSFDIPLIKNRCIINSINPKSFAVNQTDLLHLSQRIWKKRLKSCRLGNIEEQILKFARQNDIDGSLIPDMYKDYLKTGSPDNIINIIEHNKNDVVTMSILLRMLMRIEQDPVNRLDNINDIMHLGESYFNRKEYKKAEECLEAVIHAKTNPLTLYSAMKYLSMIHKKNNDREKAVWLWNKMDRMNIGAVFPLIELAKHYEHVESNAEKALFYAEKARNICIKANNKEQLSEIITRINRLNKKLIKKQSNKDENIWE